MKDLQKINFNWAAILAFVTFWSYGYYGAVSSDKIGFIWNAAITVILYSMFLFYIFLYRKSAEYKDAISITKEDILTFFSYAVILLALSFDGMRNPLQGDQIFHAQYSQLQPLHLIFNLAGKTDILNNFVFAHLLYILDLAVLILAVGLCYAFRRRSLTLKVMILSAVFIFCRAIIWRYGGYPGGHPPFRFFPLWLSSSIFSVNDVSFRLPQFIGLIGLMVVTRRLAMKRLGTLESWLFGLAIGTVPVLWHIGTLAVESIWTSIAWIALLLSISACEDFENFKWIRWVSLVSIFALMRQSAFVGLIPIFALFIFRGMERKKVDVKKGLLMMIPVFVMLPLLIKSMIFGMPSSYISGEVDFIPEGASSLQRLLIAVTSGIAARSILSSLTPVWFIFLPLAFIPFRYGVRNLLKPAVNLLFFSAAFSVFYLVSATQWGASKYQAEYAVPFAAIGLFNVLVKVKESSKGFFKMSSAAILVALIAFNIFIFKNMYAMKSSGIIFENSYSYNEAMKTIKKEGLIGRYIMVGSTYGVFTEILNGFTVSEVMRSRGKFKRLIKALGVVDLNLLNNDPDIKIILISDAFESQKIDLMTYLKTHGWREWLDFRHPKSGTTIYGFKRE